MSRQSFCTGFVRVCRWSVSSREHRIKTGHHRTLVGVITVSCTWSLTVDIHPDILVLITGDNNFAYLTIIFHRWGIRDEAASTMNMLSSQMIAAANHAIDLPSLLNNAMSLDGQLTGSVVDA